MKKPYYTYPVRLLCAILCGVVLLLSLWYVTGAFVPGESAALDVERGRAWVEQLAAKPHPRGSAEHQQVREALRKGIEDTGAQVVEMVYEVSTKDKLRTAGNTVVYPGTLLSNLLAVVPGSGSDAVLVMCHYDSTAMGPGATSSMAGVSNMLLLLEKIQQENLAFENTLLFLFADGGEEGHLGAHFFAENRIPVEVLSHGNVVSAQDMTQYRNLVLDVKLVLNISGRGTGGATTLLQTADNNLHTMEAFAEVNPGLPASSLSRLMYRQTGESTALAPFQERNIQGLDFLNVGQAYYWNTQHDDAAHLTQQTLMRSGNALYNSISRFGNEDLDALSKSRDDAVYFDYLGFFTVAMPRILVWAQVLAVAVLFCVWAVRAGARLSGGMLFRNLFLGLFVLAAGLVAGCGAIWGASYLFSAMIPLVSLRLASSLYMSLPLWAGMCVLGGFVALMVWGGLGKLFSIGGRIIRESAVLLLCVLGIVCAFLLPSTTYLFLPAGILGLLLMVLTTLRASTDPAPFGLYAIVFAAFAPFALGLSYFVLGLMGAPALPYMAIPVLLCGAFILPYALDIPTRRRVVSWLTVCAVLLVLGIGLLGVEAALPVKADPGANLGAHQEGYRAEVDDDRLLYECREEGSTALLRIRDMDMARALSTQLRSLGFQRSDDGWTMELEGAAMRTTGPSLSVRYTESLNRTTINVQKAYPESIFELHVPGSGVTNIAYEDARGSGNVAFDPISAGAPEYRIFQSRTDATVTITSQGKLGAIRYVEYLPDNEALTGLPEVAQVMELSPVIRPQLTLIWNVNVEEEAEATR